MAEIPDGLIVVEKRDCPTCVMLEDVFRQLSEGETPLTIYAQDDPSFPSGIPTVVDDTALEHSYGLNVEAVPTLIRFENGKELGRAVGWNRAEWERLAGSDGLGEGLPDRRPGCGARNVEPGIAEDLAVRFGDVKLQSRSVTLTPYDDPVEACYERGWSDGLPVVPPTRARVYRMLQGTTRDPNEILGLVPPDLAECTVEKAAVNAVLAGCRPEYFPVVLATVEAALEDEFCLHGLVATTWFSGPVVIVNGPIARAIGMNAEVNCLGQGNRANATIGRALQLIVRNVGGGKPGGVDRATMGNPGKYTFCFAERDYDTPWEPLAVERGFDRSVSTVTLFAGDGVQGILDQKSREPESLAKSFAACLRTVAHPKIGMAADAVLAVSPEHARIFEEAGWSKGKLKEQLHTLLRFPGDEMVRGAGGIAEGLPEQLAEATIPKFRPDGLQIVRAGSNAGLFSAIIGGWVASGSTGSIPVTKEIRA